MLVDLSKCKKGDRLQSSRGSVLTYVSTLPADNYYDHLVQYADGSFGTRCNDGFVYRNKSRRLDVDHNIVKILE